MARADTNLSLDKAIDQPPGRNASLRLWLLHEFPYIVFIVLSMIGISWTSLSGMPSRMYWVFFTPVAAAICIAAGWRKCSGPGARAQLIMTQVLQWGAIWIAMYLMMLGDVRGMLNDDAAGLTLLTLIALGTFISGVHTQIWRLAVVGVFLGVAVPVVALVERGALLLFLIAAALLALGFASSWLRSRIKAPEA